MSMWGGRFQKELSQEAKEYSYSLSVDQLLFPYDIQLSLAHVKMLVKTKNISAQEGKKIESGLLTVLKKFKGKNLAVHAKKFEDIHSFIQEQLESEIGAVGKKLHTARSRNDQVVTATKLFLKDFFVGVDHYLKDLQKALVTFASQNDKVIIPSYTHLQRAQAVLLAHHLLAYVEMLNRDKARFQDALKRMDVLPLGSGSVSGTTLTIDRKMVAKLLGFKKVSENSMDAVSDRDFIVETLSACSILFMHLSRLSEDLILWNSQEFSFIELSDEYTTGSSLMPHKKNPDMLELCRGRSGKVYGNLIALLTMLKGLPLAYNRDLQEDKKPLFDTVELTFTTLQVLAGTIKTAKVHKPLCELAALDSYLYATDLLDYLVEKGVAFKDAHTLVGKIILTSQKKEKDLSQLTLAEFQKCSDKIDKTVFSLFKPENSIKKKKSIGSTGFAEVKKRINYWKTHLK